MNAECFEDTLMGLASLIEDLWFEGMKIVLCYPTDIPRMVEEPTMDADEKDDWEDIV